MPERSLPHFLQRPQTFNTSPNVLHLLSLLPEEHWDVWNYQRWCNRFQEENLPYLFEQLSTIPAEERYTCVSWLRVYLPLSRPAAVQTHAFLSILFLPREERIRSAWGQIELFVPFEVPQNRLSSPFIDFKHIAPERRLAFMECVNESTLVNMTVRKAMARALARFVHERWNQVRPLLDSLFSGLDEAQAESMRIACGDVAPPNRRTFITRLHQWTASERDPMRKLAFVRNMASFTPDYHVYEVFERLECLFEGNDPAAVYERLKNVPQKERYLTLALAAIKPTPEARLAALAPPAAAPTSQNSSTSS